MLRQSSAYVRRLIAACRRWGDSEYAFHRRVNWSYRYGSEFYQEEARLFSADPTSYVGGACEAEPRIGDVYTQRLSSRQVLSTFVKVQVHWAFLLLGRMSTMVSRRRELATYRKAYVDDIELVFDPDEPSVHRAVYPFPVSVRRQWRYLGHLQRKRCSWAMAGNPYGVRDLVRFLVRRDVGALRRLESRAQIRCAMHVASRGFRRVQVSDEFDIGSLDFARTMARLGIPVVNSAHGVGKYLPVHAYQDFHVLTGRQQEYYVATRACRYHRRTLNARAPHVHGQGRAHLAADGSGVNFVFLSGQSSRGIAETYLARNEARAVERLARELAGVEQLRLLYRPHPNNHHPVAPPGFELLPELSAVNGRPNTVFASYSSTCQIDPAFDGRKILVRGEYMHPEVWFDDAEEMMELDELVDELRRLASSSARQDAPRGEVAHHAPP